MSGFGQTATKRPAYGRGGQGIWVADLVLYGLDAAGEAAFTQRLDSVDRGRFRELANTHLKDYPTVEVWDGPLCVLRLRRKMADEG